MECSSFSYSSQSPSNCAEAALPHAFIYKPIVGSITPPQDNVFVNTSHPLWTEQVPPEILSSISKSASFMMTGNCTFQKVSALFEEAYRAIYPNFLEQPTIALRYLHENPDSPPLVTSSMFPFANNSYLATMQTPDLTHLFLRINGDTMVNFLGAENLTYANCNLQTKI